MPDVPTVPSALIVGPIRTTVRTPRRPPLEPLDVGQLTKARTTAVQSDINTTSRTAGAFTQTDVERVLQEAPPLADVVGRLSDEQLRTYLGFDGAADMTSIRANPDTLSALGPTYKERADALRLLVYTGQVEPEQDRKTNGLTKALGWVRDNVPGAKVAFEALRLYNDYIGQPFTVVSVDLLNRIIPGTSDMERRVDALQKDGLGYVEARVRAFEETTDYPGWVKEGMRLILDPLIVAGVAKGLLLPGRALTAVAGAEDVMVGRLATNARFLEMTKPSATAQAFVSKHPWVQRAINTINPSATMKTIEQGSPGHGTIAWLNMLEQGAAFKEIPLAHIRSLGKFDKIFVGGVKEGRLVGLKDAPAWGDVFQKPSAYALTDLQNSYVKLFHRISDDVLQMFKDEGIAIEEIDFLDGAMHYVTRQVVAQTGPRAWVLQPLKGVGAKTSFEKSRVYAEMEEGVRDGLKYADPLETMDAYLRAAYRRIADKRLEEIVRPLTRSARPAGALVEAATAAKGAVQAARGGRQAIQRALRGEALPTSTVAALARTFPELAGEIQQALSISSVEARKAVQGLSRDILTSVNVDRVRFRSVIDAASAGGQTLDTERVIAAVDKLGLSQAKSTKLREAFYKHLIDTASAEKKAALQAVLAKVGERTAAATIEAQKAARRLSRAAKRAADIGITEGVVRAPAFQGRIFMGEKGAENAAMIEKLITEQRGQLSPWLKVPADVSGAIRFQRATTDFAAPFIQGLPLMIQHPAIWAKATKMHYEAFLDTGIRAQYITKNSAHIVHMIEHGGLLGSSEFTETMKAGGLFAKIPQKYVELSQIPRFQSSFETFLDVGRIELWKALRPTAARFGDEGLDTLASFVNKATGAVSTKALGVSLTQRQMESAWLMFAPRYTRASVALMVDMFRGGLRGQLAREALGSLLVGGGAIYMAIATALGQEPNLDPTKGNFMKVKMGDSWVGLGGKHRALFKAVPTIVKASIENPMGLIHWNILDAEHSRDNPILQFAKGQSAPGPGTLLTFLNGEDAISRTVPSFSDEPIEWAKFLGTQLAPFAIQGALEQGQFDVGGYFWELSGAVNTPLTASQKRAEIRDRYAKEGFGQEWHQLSPGQQAELEEKHEDLDAADATVEESERQFGRSRRRVAAFTQMDAASKLYLDQVNGAAKLLEAGAYSPDQFRNAIAAAADRRNGKSDLIRDNFADVFEGIEEYKEGLSARNVVALALDDYMARMFSTETQDAAGEYVPEKGDAVRAELVAEHGEATVAEVEKEIERRRLDPQAGDLHPLAAEYFQAQQTLRAYWDAYKEVLQPNDYPYWRILSRADPRTRAQLVQIGRYASVWQRVETRRRQLRLRSKEIDWALAKFYGYTPLLPSNLAKLRTL